MTPKEEKWLAEYRRREAAEAAKMQRRALWFWGMFAVVCLAVRFSEPDKKFSFWDSLFLMMIVINVFNTVRELIRNRRIAAGEKPQKQRTTTQPNNDNFKI